MNYSNCERGGNPSFGWPHPDSLSRGSATQHPGFVSQPVDVHPSTSWDLPFQQQGCTGFQPYEGPTPTSWDHPTTRVGEFHVPCSYWEPTAPRGTSTQVTSSVPLSPPSSASSPYEFDPILGRPRTSWDLPRPRIAPESCSNPSDWDYSDPYAYDSPFHRPLTSWDLPSPRFESYGGGGSSQYEYEASENHGGGSYAPYSNYGGGYSGGRYVNEPNPYVPPPPPPREGNYVLAPQPKPPFSLPEWRLSTWDLGSHPATTPAAPILAPSLPLVQHQLQPLPAPCATPPPPSRDDFYVPVPQPCVSDPPPSRPELVPRPANPEIEEKERGRVSFSIGSKLVEEAGDSKVLDSAGTQKPNPVKATHGSGIGEGDPNNAVESSAVVNNDNELDNKFQVDGSSIVIWDVVRGEQQGCETKITPFLKEIQMEYIDARRSNEMQRFKNHKIQEIFDAPNAASDGDMYKKGKWRLNYLLHLTESFAHFAKGRQSASQKNWGGRGRHASKLTDEEEEILEVSRGLVIFGIYALEEVYRDLLNLHLEDKVILKGGGVDTLIT